MKTTQYHCRCVQTGNLFFTDGCPVHTDSPEIVKPHQYGGHPDSDVCYYCGLARDSEAHVMNEQPNSLSGRKHDSGKPPMALLSSDALFEVAKVLEFGSKKYDSWNWKGGFQWSRIASAVLRHIFQWLRGEDRDPETGLSHLSHAACGLLFLIDFEVNKLGEDDRYKGKK